MQVKLWWLLFCSTLMTPVYADMEAAKRAYFRGDYETAVNEWLAEAKEGDTLASLAVGVLYKEGLGVPKNASEAVRWFRRAAERPGGLAELFTAWLYLVGDNVPKDEAVAKDWFRKAAAKGLLEAEIWLRLFSPELLPELLGWLEARVQSREHECLMNCPEYRLAYIYLLGKDQSGAERWQNYLLEHGSPYDLWQIGKEFMRRDFDDFVAESGQKTGKEPHRLDNKVKAITFLRRSAEKGFAPAQFSLGLVLSPDWLAAARRLGTPTNEGDATQAIHWTERAAEQGYPSAQSSLGNCYEFGKGIYKNFVLAYKWYSLAVALGEEANDGLAGFAGRWTKTSRDRVASQMTADQIAVASELIRNWKPSKEYFLTRENSTLNYLDLELSRPSPTIAGSSLQSAVLATGTAFIVSLEGYVVTTDHVTRGCNRTSALVNGKRFGLVGVASDPTNDLAVLKLAERSPSFASFRVSDPVKQGETVVAVGFPLPGLLGSSASVTTGTISALSGIGDDTRMMQFTAPVQPGNSGGPLLDQSGYVIGVVVSKLNALKVAKFTGDIPQNVNFAIKTSVVRTFLDANGIEYVTAPSTARLETSVIAERAGKFTVVVECWK